MLPSLGLSLLLFLLVWALLDHPVSGFLALSNDTDAQDAAATWTRANSFLIETKGRPRYDDQYCSVVKAAPRHAYGKSIIGFIPTPSYAAHHIILHRCKGVASPNAAERAEEPANEIKDICSRHSEKLICSDPHIIFVWANGGQPLFFPPNGVSIPIREGEVYQVSVHFGRALNAEWPTDRSGIRVVYHEEPPKHIPGVILLVPTITFNLRAHQHESIVSDHTRSHLSFWREVTNEDEGGEEDGDPASAATTKHKMTKANNKKAAKNKGTAEGQSFYLFAIRVHAHERGLWNEMRVFNNPDPAAEPIWSYRRSTQLAQSFVPLPHAIEVRSSDTVDFACAYDTTKETRETTEGATKHDEMCNIYLYGYWAASNENVGDSTLMDAENVIEEQDDDPHEQPPPPLPKLEEIVLEPRERENALVDQSLGTTTQIVGVSIDYSVPTGDSIWVFTRGDRIWDGTSFDGRERFQGQPIDSPVLFQVNASSGVITKRFGAEMFYLPHSVRSDPHDPSRIWVLDVGAHTATVVSAETGEALFTVGTQHAPGKSKGHLCQPTDVSFSPTRAFISDGYCNDRVVVVDRKNGGWEDEWRGKRGSHAGFVLPHGIVAAVESDDDAEETLIVCDREAPALVMLSVATGKTIGRVDFPSGDYPYGSTVVGGNLMVVGIVQRADSLGPYRRKGHLWVAWLRDLLTPSGGVKSQAVGRVIEVEGLAEPHELSSSGDLVFVAEAIDGNRRGRLWSFTVRGIDF